MDEAGQSELQNTTTTKDSESPYGKFLLIILGFLICTASAFLGGFYLNNVLVTQRMQSASPSPTPQIENYEENPGIGSKNVAGNEYYDDTIMALSTSLPRRILIGTVTREVTDGGAIQNTRSSYFDGESWTRKLLTKAYSDTSIHSNAIVNNWSILIDPSRVLKQSVKGGLTVGNNKLEFETGVIDNNIGMRSLPGYTKFISTGTGKLVVNGSTLPANILYTRIYSNNADEIQSYGTPIGATTHWIAFWDDDGNVYHIDSTYVSRPTKIYETHQIGVMVDSNGRVSKTYDVKIDISGEKPPKSYSFQLGAPINKNGSFTIGVSINKAPNNAYTWYMSEGVGEVEGVAGFGVVEYIQD